jgi:hypothetical protein
MFHNMRKHASKGIFFAKILLNVVFLYDIYTYSESLLQMQCKLVKFVLIKVESEEIFG